MKNSFFICVSFFLVSLHANAQEEDSYTSDSILQEETLLYLNKFRTQPTEMALWYAQSDYYDAHNSYDKSLLQKLQLLEPMDTLKIDMELTESASCHAGSSGINSHVGHDRVGDCSTDFDAECIQYGLQDPLDVVIELLEDHGNPDYGHREILLSPIYHRIGIAQRPHKRYQYNTVLDLKK